MSSKRISIYSVLTLSLLLLGCGKGKTVKDTETSDSIMPDTVVENTVEELPDSLKIFYSDDLKSFAIHGDVLERSSVRHGAEMVYPEPTMELTFDSIGNFTGSLQGLYAKKNEEGFNYSYSMNYEDGTSWELTYTEYNDENYPVKATIIESGPQGTATSELTYYGYEYDKEKNWVFRCVTMGREFTDIDTGEKLNSFKKWKEAVSYKYR